MLTRVEVHETHTGIVILVGDRAYKVKKPIRTDFLDFREPRARELVCAQEVLLNGRLAPDSYLGVGHFAEPGGDVNEPVIVMRRYPDDRRLASLVERAEPVEHHLLAIAEILARFHADASRSAVVDADAHPDVLAERWNENMTVLEHYAGRSSSVGRWPMLGDSPPGTWRAARPCSRAGSTIAGSWTATAIC